MLITNLVINFFDIQDALALENNAIVENIFSIAQDIIRQGGKLTIQIEYTNAPPEIVAVYTNIADVSNWKNDLIKAQDKLDRRIG